MRDAGSPRARPFENTRVYGMRMNHPDRRKIDNTLYGNRIRMIDRPDWDLRLGYLIHDVSRLRRMMFDRALAPLGITRSQWWVLAFISRKDGLPQTQLANELDVGKVGVGALIDRLESSGFVLRQADPVDGRVKRVFVTKQARGFLEKLRKETDKFNAQINHGIDRKALEATSDALLAMKHNLLAMSDGTILPGNRAEEDLGKKRRPRKGKKAA
jgi:DNA-binding MarR family transcriptional regulator